MIYQNLWANFVCKSSWKHYLYIVVGKVFNSFHDNNCQLHHPVGSCFLAPGPGRPSSSASPKVPITPRSTAALRAVAQSQKAEFLPLKHSDENYANVGRNEIRSFEIRYDHITFGKVNNLIMAIEKSAFTITKYKKHIYKCCTCSFLIRVCQRVRAFWIWKADVLDLFTSEVHVDITLAKKRCRFVVTDIALELGISNKGCYTLAAASSAKACIADDTCASNQGPKKRDGENQVLYQKCMRKYPSLQISANLSFLQAFAKLLPASLELALWN